MVDLCQTRAATGRLLTLMRCDHCDAALHEPYTTGVCEHVLCVQCSPAEQGSTAASECPVCRVPVYPKDCRLHPQIAHLLLVARRLKKLTADPNSDATVAAVETITNGCECSYCLSCFIGLSLPGG